jgi:hypothetical protein
MTPGIIPGVRSCPAWAELARLVDGELTENRARAVRRHLAACRRCGAEVEGLERLVAELAAPPRGVRLHGAVEAIMGRLDEPLPPAATRRGRRRPLALALTAGLSAAVLLLAVVGLLLAGHTAPPSPSPAVSSRAVDLEQGPAPLQEAPLLEPVSRARENEYWPGSVVRHAGGGVRSARGSRGSRASRASLSLMQLLLQQSRPVPANDDELGGETCVCRRRPALLQSM